MKKFLILLATTVGTTAFASDFYVKEITSVGVGKDEAVAVTEIVKNSVPENGEHQVVGESSKAQYILSGKIMKLGSAYLMTLEKLQGSKVVFTNQLRADKLEDLDNVAARLTRAVISEKAAKDDTRVMEVNENDKLVGTKRRDTVKRWEVALGAASLGNSNDNNTEFNFLLGYEWEIPTSNASVKLFMMAPFILVTLQLQGTRFFGDSDSSPLLTVNFGYGAGSVKTDNIITTVSSTVSGFIAGVGAGYRFFRTSTINVETLDPLRLFI